jgi:hypothetical protein
MLTAWDAFIQFAFIGYFLWVVYVTRLPATPQATTPKTDGTRLVAGVLLFSTFMAILPSVTLPIGFDGQQSRFSFLGSVFSVLFFICAGTYILKDRKVRMIAACGTAIVLYGALVPPTDEWVRAGDISRETARAIISTPRSHKTFILAAPRSYGSADLFLGGLESIPFVMLGKQDPVVVPGLFIDGLTADDIVESEALGDNRFSVTLKPSEASRENGLEFHWHDILPDFKVYANTGSQILLRITDYKPGDRVISIDADGPHFIR